MGGAKIVLLILALGMLAWFLFFRKPRVPVPVAPQLTPVYKWKGKTLKNENDLYCGFFGKRIVKTAENGVVTIECECDPVEIENGSFDHETWDYTCNDGYTKWFDLDTKRKYRSTPGLRDDISLRELYAKKPDDEPYCVPK